MNHNRNERKLPMWYAGHHQVAGLIKALALKLSAQIKVDISQVACDTCDIHICLDINGYHMF